MRSWLSIVGLVLVLAVVGFLLRQQVSALRSTAPALAAPNPARPPSQSRQQQPFAGGPAQLQQQYRQALEQAIQPPRPVPDDLK